MLIPPEHIGGWPETVVYIVRVTAKMGEEMRERELVLAEFRSAQRVYWTAREMAEHLNIPVVPIALALHELVTEGALSVDHASRPPAYRLAMAAPGIRKVSVEAEAGSEGPVPVKRATRRE